MYAWKSNVCLERNICHSYLAAEPLYNGVKESLRLWDISRRYSAIGAPFDRGSDQEITKQLADLMVTLGWSGQSGGPAPVLISARSDHSPSPVSFRARSLSEYRRPDKRLPTTQLNSGPLYTISYLSESKY